MQHNDSAIAQAGLARRDLHEYCQRMIGGFDKDAEHAKYLIRVLMAVERGEIRRVVITAPPGFGKSTLLQAFESWAIGRDPHRKLITLSATERLAIRNSSVVRAQMQDEQYPFANAALSTDSKSVTDWMTSAGGGMRAIGAHGTVTGFRADGVVCDDLQPDVMTSDTRDSLEEFFRRTLTTRLEPWGWVAVIQTRWNIDDLIARLEEGESSELWTFINLTALCEDPQNDPLQRERGASLWPARWPVELLQQRKLEVGSATFDAQYMGHPMPEGGRIFVISPWFDNRYDSIPGATPPNPNVLKLYARATDLRTGLPYLAQVRQPTDELPALSLSAIDCALKENVAGSYSALVNIALVDGIVYLREVERRRLPFDELLNWIRMHRVRNRVDILIIEDAAAGAPAIEVLKHEFRIEPVPALGSKASRAMSITTFCEQGCVRFPRSAPWLPMFERELANFSGEPGEVNDMVDAFVHVIRYASGVYAQSLNVRRMQVQMQNRMSR